MSQLLSATTIVYLMILTITVFINAFGIYFISRTRGTYTNQKIILVNLSICQILLAISRMIYRLMDFYEIPTEDKYKQIALVFLYVELSTYYLFMISLTVDRFIACKHPLRYSIILSRKRVKKYLTVAWFLGVAVHFPQIFFSSMTAVFIFNYVTLPVLDFAFVATAAVGYGYILHKMHNRKLKRLPMHGPRMLEQRKRNYKFYKMAAIINLRFFLLIIIPDIIFAIYFTGNFGSNNTLRVILITCWYTNPIFDPITYIFMQKDIGKDVRRLFARKTSKTTECKGQKEVYTSSLGIESAKIFDTRL